VIQFKDKSRSFEDHDIGSVKWSNQ